MHRTEGANYGLDSEGRHVFKETPLPPTTIGADIMNAVVNELCNAVEASGQTLETAATDTAHNQLALALAAAQDVYDVSVSSQSAFNDLWERTGANAYKIKDGIRSVLLKYLSGGYYLTGATSPLSAGDTYGVFSTNQMTRLDCTGGTQIEFGNDNGKLVIDTEEASYSNLKLHRGVGAQELLTISATRTNSLTVRKMYAANNYSIICVGGSATGSDTISIGEGSVASGISSSAFGTNSLASGNGALASGNEAAATNSNSSAYGHGSFASGEESVSIGTDSDASGYQSCSFGYGANVSGSMSSSIGWQATNTEAGVVKIGHSSATVKVQNAIVVISDRRDKTGIEDNDAGLEVLNKIKTRKFRLNPRESYFKRDAKNKLVFENGVPVIDEDEYASESKAGKRWHRGVVAQEIAEQFNSTEFAFIKDSKVNSPDSFDQIGVDYQEFIAILIKSVQELSAKVKTLETKIAEVENG